MSPASQSLVVSQAAILESLARQYHGELLRVLRDRLHDDDDAAEIAQEAYSRLMRYPSLSTIDDLRNLLFRIAHNLLIDHWRRGRVHGKDMHIGLEDALEVPSDESPQDRRVLAQQQVAAMERVVLKMPAKRRTVFLLSRIQGLPHAEVARRCGISIKMVEKHLALAVAQCRAEVGELSL